MTSAELLDLFEYNRWAHGRAIEAARELTGEDYSRKITSSFPSLRATLEHMLAAEVIWLSRWEGHSLGEPPDYSGCADVTSLERIWQSFWKRQFRFVESLADDALDAPVVIRTRSGIETVQPLAETMVHVVSHSSYHRGQAATLTRQLGGTPRNTDYFMYCLGRGAPDPETTITE
jgi:uncharacterized damage-inducible protein DinB